MEKKLFVIALTLPFNLAVSLAQNDTSAAAKHAVKPAYPMSKEMTVAPMAVIDAFKKLFPKGEKEKFEREKNGEYEANFKLNGIDMSANFTSDGGWRETETTIPVSQLPESVVEGIKMKFPKAKIVGAAKIETPSNGLKYEADLLVGKKKTEVLLDASGAYIN